MKAILLIMVFLLAGCSATMTTTTTAPDGTSTVTQQPGSMLGPSSYDIGYRDMYVAHEQSKQDRADAILSQQSPSDPVAKAYSDTNKILAIALISMEKFDVKAPVTGFDVLYKLTDSVVPVAGFGALYKLGEVAIKNAGSAISGNATVTNSLNRSDSTSLATGTNTSASASSTGTAPPTVVQQAPPVQTIIVPTGFTVSH